MKRSERPEAAAKFLTLSRQTEAAADPTAADDSQQWDDYITRVTIKTMEGLNINPGAYILEKVPDAVVRDLKKGQCGTDVMASAWPLQDAGLEEVLVQSLKKHLKKHHQFPLEVQCSSHTRWLSVRDVRLLVPQEESEQVSVILNYESRVLSAEEAEQEQQQDLSEERSANSVDR
ncbi:unnamed protein product [Pleuronectes platessa]|uniref:Uncharacterized protein n=1 Tax=Pleuronectes platessa TaxID=8262 RepID=A0A9N7VV78_PLEPL|nr:unnamed protein product [Pleuronectes platessa]